MMNLTLTVSVPSHQPVPSRRRFLNLPLELRNLIYHYALVSPPKHSLGHRPDCHFRQNHTRTSIEPLASYVLSLNVAIVPSQMVRYYETPVECSCAKRAALNLLLACRQVHREAAPIFWSRNVFVFDHPDEFTNCVGERLRADHRPLLRSVYIASADPWDTVTRGGFVVRDKALDSTLRWTQFWGVLHQCSGLRALAVRPEVVRMYASEMASLEDRLPKLRRLELTWVGRYRDRSTRGMRAWVSFRTCAEMQRNTVFARASRAVAFRGPGKADFSAAGCKEVYRDFTTNFCVHVDSAIRDRFFERDEDGNRDLVDLHAAKTAAAGLDDSRRMHALRLPTGETARVTFMGLPQSQKTRVGLLKARLAADAALRALGKPTVAEEKLLRVVKERKATKKEEAADQELCEREKLRRAVEENAEERRLGRKRVLNRRCLDGVEEGMEELSL
ncbi:hypothetical protein EsH8_VI_001125 [Colletotrichum jinshuiense]